MFFYSDFLYVVGTGLGKTFFSFFDVSLVFFCLWGLKRKGDSNLFMEDLFYGHVSLSWKCLCDWCRAVALFNRWWLSAQKLAAFLWVLGIKHVWSFPFGLLSQSKLFLSCICSSRHKQMLSLVVTELRNTRDGKWGFFWVLSPEMSDRAQWFSVAWGACPSWANLELRKRSSFLLPGLKWMYWSRLEGIVKGMYSVHSLWSGLWDAIQWICGQCTFKYREKSMIMLF